MPENERPGSTDASPEVLDLLVVGGGPAGTAAAFRARELGLAVRVIDYDDLMKRIRDYAKEKLILPHFGGGDAMQFPAGGDLIAALQFGPIDKDDLCARWRGLYESHRIPWSAGLELTGLESRPDGLITARTWDHRGRVEALFTTRHVALSIGRGVPRRFDIPGDTAGITYRLDDALTYVGAPVCVIGGGTSAAEAVIAISNAKAAAGDTCPVYWSYRGNSMPKVSRALSEVFFEAYLGNGNIRYYPGSEPVAVLVGPDREEYVSIRVDRRLIDGRSIETTHLEFPKTQCIACIGEDIPEAFLESLGVSMVTGGPKAKKRMAVTPLLETRVPNVYLIGDILSPAYLETDDHAGDPAGFREIRRAGNIKAALRDGVFIAEVVRQKVDGRAQVEVALRFAEDLESPSAGGEASASFLRDSVQPDEVPPATSPRLIRVTLAGVEEDEYALPGDRITIGQAASNDVALPGESSIAEHHATITRVDGVFHLRDEGSKAGTFLQLPSGQLRPLANGDLLQIGRQFLVFTRQNEAWQCTHYDHVGTVVGRHDLADGTIVLGREAPDIVLGPDDRMVSRRHIALQVKDGGLAVKDLNSLNHTYLRIRSDYPIRHDEVIRLGQVLFRLSEHRNEPAKAVSFVGTLPPEPIAPPAAASPAVAAPAVAGGPSVTFEGRGGPFALGASETVLAAAKKHDIPINYECESGRCGYDPVRILSGAEHLNEMDEDEEGWTVEEVCKLKPGEHRLACMLKARGPVVVQIVEK
ncbi:MAG: FHA domain-containing protein [Rhodothermales bacterium]